MAAQDKPNSPAQPTTPPPSVLPPPVEAEAEYLKPTRYPNPPEETIPDPATLREQWKFATRQYSRWYGRAWGTAILAGAAFFGLGWLVKGSNPLPSRSHPDDNRPHSTATER